LHEINNAGDFKEDEQPRDSDGKFTSGGKGSSNIKSENNKMTKEDESVNRESSKKKIQFLIKNLEKDNSFKSEKLGKVDNWIAEQVKKTSGIDVKDYEHEISSDFIAHIKKNHPEMTDSNIEEIPDLIETPDYMIFGFKRDNEDRIAYAKRIDNETTLYFEEVLGGKRRKAQGKDNTLRSKTIFIMKGNITEKKVLEKLKNDNRKRNDISKAKVMKKGANGSQANLEVDEST
jgi:hypothetical protein